MSPELVLLRVALVLGLWAIPLVVGLVAHLGHWPRPALIRTDVRPASDAPPIDRAA